MRVSQRCTSQAAARQHWLPGRGGFWAASRQERPIRRRTLEAGLVGLPSLLLLPSAASAAGAPPQAAAPSSGSSGGLPGGPPAASLEGPAAGSAGGRPGGRSTQGGGLLEDQAQRNPSEASEVDGGSEDDSGSESDSSSSSSSDEEGEGRERRPAARRKQPEATRQTEEQLRARMKEDKRRAKEQEKAAKLARKEEQRLRQEAEQGQAVAAAQGGDLAGPPPADGRRHGPSELPYPAAAGDAGLGSEGGEVDKQQLSWLLGQLLQ